MSEAAEVVPAPAEVAPAIVGMDKAIQLRRQRSTVGAGSQEPTPSLRHVPDDAHQRQRA